MVQKLLTDLSLLFYRTRECRRERTAARSRPTSVRLAGFGHGTEIEITYEIRACVAEMGDLVPGRRVNCEDISTEKRVPTTSPADE